MSETPLSAEAQELLRRMKLHTTESLECVYRRIDDVAKEQTAQRKMHAHAMVVCVKTETNVKAHEKRLDKVEVSESRVTRKVYTLSGIQTALFALIHFFKGH